MVGLVHEASLRAALRGAGHVDAGRLIARLGEDVRGTERRTVARSGGVDVGDVVADGVEPLAVHRQSGAGDADRIEGHEVLIAVRIDVNEPFTACVANW